MMNKGMNNLAKNKALLKEESRKSLDIDYILNKIRTHTPYGKIYRDKIKPFFPGNEEGLREELEKVELFIDYAKDRHFSRGIENLFVHVKDLRSTIRRSMEGVVLSEVELFEIKTFLFILRDLEKLLDKYNVELWDDMKVEAIPKLETILDPEETGISTFYIYDSYSEELKKIREAKRNIIIEVKRENNKLKDEIKKDLKLKVSPDGSILVSKGEEELLKKVENYPYLTYLSETYMHVKYCFKPTDNIINLENKLTLLKEREEKEEYKIREKLSKDIGKKRKKLFGNIASIGKIDFILGKANLALKLNGVKPEVLDQHSLYIKEGRHPKVESFLKEKELSFTPITISLKETVTCITGANMGGKTVSLKLVGLLAAMAQYGLFVPAKEMKLGLNDFICTSIGDRQDLDEGLSTFGGEIKLIQEALENSQKKGLILIDELARGTNPEEGYAISKAIVKYLKERNSITLITTHYDNIASIEGVVHLQVVGLSKIDFSILKAGLEKEKVDKLDLINRYMDYGLMEVKDTKGVPRDALNIARLMGLNGEVVKLAEKILDQ